MGSKYEHTGGYVAVALPAGENSVSSAAQQFLQPGQAAFVRTKENGPASIEFGESDKAVDSPQTKVFSEEKRHLLKIQLLSGGKINDGLLVEFAENSSNAILLDDAPKLANIDENLAVVNHDNYLSIEHRAMPKKDEALSLFVNQYRKISYQLKVEVRNMPENTLFFKDAYLKTQTALGNNAVTFISFEVNETLPESKAADRFSIVFSSDTLMQNTVRFKEFSIYPSVLKKDRFSVNVPSDFNNRKVVVRIYDMLGQQVWQTVKNAYNSKFNVAGFNLSPGVYIVKLNTRNVHFSKKIIVE